MTATSVLTLVRNRPGHLEQLVEGLRRSRSPPGELIVVDLGDTPVAVADPGFPVRIVTLDGMDLPLARARNLAAHHARHETLVFLDVDCIPDATVVQEIGAALSSHDALVAPEVLYLGPDDARQCWTEADLRASGMSHPARSFPKIGLRHELNSGLFWSLAFGIRRSTFDRLGGFDERFVGYGGEDTDLGFRAERADVPLLCLGGPAVFHQHHAIHDPPLQHFEAVVRNAILFRSVWGLWPMTGWLDAMVRQGLISLEPERLEIIRLPSAEDVAATLKPAEARF